MTPRWLALLLVAPALGCVNEDDIIADLVTQYCQTRWQSCSCESPGVTEIQCESMLKREGEAAQAEAQEAGLTFDKDCAKRKLERFEPICDVPLGQTNDECYPGICSLYHGDVGAGGACTETETGTWSTCAQGLVCDIMNVDGNGTCVDPCAGRRRGDPCGGDVNIDCLGDLVCTAEGACGDAPKIGESCGAQCTRGASCDLETRRCVASGRTGDPCPEGNNQCGDGYRCVDEACAVDEALVCLIREPL